jgi:uncharacterized metal-binding protein YceD (DUF177 family)
MITVIVGEIPEEGLRLAGQTTDDIFSLPETEMDARPSGPVRYDLFLSEAGSGLILAQGMVSAPFKLRCVTCLEEFPFTVDLIDYAAEFDLPAHGPLDMTERIREDLLIDLPAYPHCDRDSDEPDRVCPAAGKFDGGGQRSPEGPGVWGALDGLNTPGD